MTNDKKSKVTFVMLNNITPFIISKPNFREDEKPKHKQ
jgi:hypothetical protein